jgi:SpoIID/LytB domain protein
MKEPIVSIGILSEKEIHFDLYGEYINQSDGNKFSGRFKAAIDGDKIKISNENKEQIFPSGITFLPEDIEAESFLLRDVVIGRNFHWEKKENQRFRGSLRFIKEKDLITAINILPLEEYLTSVISSEMSLNSSPELLKAHAIVSRGWLLAQLDKKQQNKKNKYKTNSLNEDEIIRWYDHEDHLYYDFCADDHCQRYQGVTKIVNENALNAINNTRGLALEFENIICDTRYSKCCGGITESFENVWEPVTHPYLSSVIDYKFELDDYETDLTVDKSAVHWIKSSPNAFCNTSDQKILSQVLVDFDRSTNDFFRWQVDYTQNEIAELVRSKSGFDCGNILDLIPLERGHSGRIIKLKIIGNKKSLIIGKELEIRKTLSPTHLYSSAFFIIKEEIINKIPQRFIIKGAGWGHGVGLCQIGAAVMSELGYGFDEILTHYFKNSVIRKIY